MNDAINLDNLVRDLSTRSGRAMLSQLGLRSTALRSHLRELFGQDPGAPGSILADPVLEATFGWETADEDMGALAAGGLLLHSLVDAMHEPPQELRAEYAFPRDRQPFTHQLQAWTHLLADQPQSAIVTSGTGSGKTECFLVPILESLARERATAGRLTGVRALFLYPLNALINSQRDRLRAWCNGFGTDIRFCLYNGETPRDRPSAANERAAGAEQICRPHLYADPAPILVTNATMLEYMLVRTEDQPILEQSRRKLAWIVLDEAHTYMGSQAADLALLLRRVMYRFEVDRSQVRFVATSATIGGPGAADDLRSFLADVSGADPDRVHVISGRRKVPELEPIATDVRYPPEDRSPEALYDALCAHKPARRLRERLAKGPARMTELESALQLDRNGLSQLVTDTSSATRNDNFFTPVRAHLFHRTQSGLWACVNRDCSARRPGDDEWDFGAIYHERREFCSHCESPVYEITACSECGQDYLNAYETFDARSGTQELRQCIESNAIDEFRLEVDDDPDTDGEDAVSEEDRRLICADGLDGSHIDRYSMPPGTRRFEPPNDSGVPINLILPDAGRLVCGRCGQPDRGDLFRALRIGAPFVLSTLIPSALESTPPLRRGANLPSDGRRILGFSDSRQGSARLAVRLEQEAERNRVRSVLYHALASKRLAQDPEVAEKKRAALADLPELEALAEIREGLKKELAEAEGATTAGRLSWSEAAEHLLADESLRTMHAEFRRTSHISVSLHGYADFCLFREFFRRPRRMNSAETLGLIAIRYPKLETAQAPSHWPLDPQAWPDFLKLLLDFFARANGAVDVPDRYVDWMGIPVRKNYVQGPETLDVPLERRQVRWPGARRGTMGRLLLKVANLDGTSDYTRDLVNDLLATAWVTLKRHFQAFPQGYVLQMKDFAELAELETAAVCPYTARVLDTTLAGFSPYLPTNSPGEPAVPFEVPRIPYAYWRTEGGGTETPEAVAHWLNSDEAVQVARLLGVWSNLNDRVVSMSPYFAAAEHSAQISGNRLRKLEDRFKEGKLNVLSCSTTMEMGVDIGGLSAVVMNNAPPSSANYLQRAGRAGRCGEGASFCVALCPSTPHGEQVFKNPLWAFEDEIAAPRVTLDSERLVQRHVNSLCLSSFLEGRDAQRLQAGWFFDEQETGTSPALEFVEFCRTGVFATSRLREGLRTLVHRSVLADASPDGLLGACADAMTDAIDEWRREVDALRTEAERMRGDKPDSREPAVVAIERQLQRIEHEYLLRELVNRRFLPGYGFPTGVVAFVPLTMDDIKADEQKKEREDGFGTRQGFPSREVSIAIREYAPGAEVVVDGRVYESAGITLNWHMPPGVQDIAETQAIQRVWRCTVCGANGAGRNEPRACPACGADELQLRFQKFLEPAGFAVDIASHAHNNVVSPRYIPVEEPWISCPSPDWISFANPELGRFRYTDSGHIFVGNKGIYGHGYAVCLRCGRAASETAAQDAGLIPAVFQDEHSRLRGGRDPEGRSRCDGSDHQFAVQREVTLGASRLTDVFELQLTGLASGTAALSLGIALRRAFTRQLGVSERDVGVVVRPSRQADGSNGQSIFLFDESAGGNGYVAALRDEIAPALQKARQVLNCINDCDAACHGCLLTYSTQFAAAQLDRHEAIAWLSDAVLSGLRLPEDARYLGDESHALARPLTRHIAEIAGSSAAEEIRLFFSGRSTAWDTPDFTLHDNVLRWLADGRRVRLVIDPDTWQGLDDGNRHALASLVTASNNLLQVYVTSVQSEELAAGATVLASVGIGRNSILWASGHDQTTSALNGDWGRGEDGAAIVYRRVPGPLPPLPGQSLPLAELRPTPQGTTTTLEFTEEFNGPASQFGLRFWTQVMQQCPSLIQIISAAGAVAQVNYSDRYLKSPWTMLLLRDVVLQLTSIEGVIDSSTRFELLTRELDMRSAYLNPPRLIEHDWRDEVARRDFIATAIDVGASGLRWPGRFRFSTDREVPHFRALDLIWENGTAWSLKFDQGFGYWRCRGGRREFPFDASAREQSRVANRLLESIQVSTVQRHPTFVYVAERASTG